VVLEEDDPAAGAAPAEARWLDRATVSVEDGLSRLGISYLETLVRVFERRWQKAESERQQVAAAEAPPAPTTPPK
jgi:hypothetical protein